MTAVNLCEVCKTMLQEHKGRDLRAIEIKFDHHATWEDLYDARLAPCCICNVIVMKIESDDELMKTAKSISDQRKANGPATNLRGASPRLLRARLSIMRANSVLPDEEKTLFSLTFRLDREVVGNFVLKPIFHLDETPNSSVSANTFSDETMDLAKKWIDECTSSHEECASATSGDEKSHYPTRLLDVTAYPKKVELVVVRSRGVLDIPFWISATRLLWLSLLRRSKTNPRTVTGDYATLSHCWGDPEKVIQLRRSNIHRFIWCGIDVDRLPRSFKEAIEVARRLGVRYIWIDSLCIIQPPSEEDPSNKSHKKKLNKEKPDKGRLFKKNTHESDWEDESKRMHEVYGHSYCNISATDSDDSQKGLFRNRSTERWWIGLVSLKVEGIPGYRYDGNNDNTNENRKVPPQLCEIEDAMFWDVSVNNAKVNQRGWVLQERLMAPRVLHFCHDQIAWECSRRDAAECFPDNIRHDSNQKHTRLGYLPPGRFKNLDSRPDGLRQNYKRLSTWKAPGVIEKHKQRGGEKQADGMPGGVKSPPAGANIGTLETWSRIVEVYSRAKLTHSEDKLIALAGIERMISAKLPGVKYLAGLWDCHLISQLTWYIEPEFKWTRGGNDGDEGVFRYPARRQATYRAPTWSWASVDAPTGIMYGDILPSNHPHYSISPDNYGAVTVIDSNYSGEFGLEEGRAWLQLKGMLKRIALTVDREGESIRFHWKFVKEEREVTMSDKRDTKNEMRKGIYRHVYLDCPESDLDLGFPVHQAYCLPVGCDHGGYFSCLLLVHSSEDRFKRIGLTWIPNFDTQSRHDEVLRPSEANHIPGCDWDSEEKKHVFKII